MCAIYSDGGTQSDTAGTSADCDTNIVNKDKTKKFTITFSNPQTGHDGPTYIYIEKLS
jgi:hypothetical protein